MQMTTAGISMGELDTIPTIKFSTALIIPLTVLIKPSFDLSHTLSLVFKVRLAVITSSISKFIVDILALSFMSLKLMFKASISVLTLLSSFSIRSISSTVVAFSNKSLKCCS